MYKLVRPLLFQLGPERTHDITLEITSRFPPFILRLFSGFYRFEHPSLATRLFDIDFPNPVGLAAGYDKNGSSIDFLSCLGFGFVEVGTVTPRPQQGNPKPRLFHLPEERALLNRMGFNNKGIEYLAERLKQRKYRVIAGANIGKNKETPNAKALGDYIECFEKLAPLLTGQVASYVVINVSSPNTPGLRQLQDKTFVRELLARLSQPTLVFVKIGSELSTPQLHNIIEAVLQRDRTGIIATNTLKQTRNGVGEGGMSGKPLEKRSTEVVGHIFKQSHGRIPIIGVGGIFSAQDAYEKIKAGASLVQLYTGLVYEGPGLVKRVKKGLVELLERDGFSSVADAVGKQ